MVRRLVSPGRSAFRSVGGKEGRPPPTCLESTVTPLPWPFRTARFRRPSGESPATSSAAPVVRSRPSDHMTLSCRSSMPTWALRSLT